MARIATYDVTTATKEIKEVFAEIEGAFGKVPNLFLTYANHLPLLKANWNKVKAVMGEGTLSQKTKQAIAVLVSRDNAAPTVSRLTRERCGQLECLRKR
ncbi:hypothetical protein [Geotalea toluenoxydans]|uniref:hypothetical protein n=1 Tax=Geotalea toluenoxydans TaxID=421624 RepID=UPI000A9A55C9|nr:hypothetical protein [Geotalea toluenoxydans]